MDRMACVDVFELPLQILLDRAPQWRGLPVVVVDEDRPQGVVLWSNAAARALEVRPGMRYASALSLSRELRASVVPLAAVGAVVAKLARALRRFTPNVEPSVDEPGVFWLDASGLGRLFPTLDAWAAEVIAGLGAEGFEATAAVGFTRFGSYAAAKGLGRQERVVFERPEDEREAAGRVPLHRLALPARARERLDRLGVRTVAELVALPPSGVRKRYGAEVHALQQLARGDLFDPLVPVHEEVPARARVDLELPDSDPHRLLFRIKRLLDTVVPIVAERLAVIAELRLRLVLDGGAGPPSEQRHRLRPAASTLDTALLLDLVRLRLEAVDLTAGVVEVHLSARQIPATADQLRLFALAPRRDQGAAERALARIRAELGDGAVGVFTLRDGHLPKARAAFVPLERLPTPSPRPAPGEGESPRSLVRRLLPRPVPLPAAPRSLRNDGWRPRDPQQGAIVAVDGPFVVSGGWWGRAEVHREYAFARTLRGDILWIFYDRKRRRWYEQGRVE
ncbi:MAG: DNA repair nucleotidyltransferase [Proteobacteria bacterium]|nr:MAG: DNA repair nucleotidyltransferase [Pseudomonadota bacterium]